MIALVSSPLFTEHWLPEAAGHPERPDRIRAVHAALRQAAMIPRAIKEAGDEATRAPHASGFRQIREKALLPSEDQLPLDLDFGLSATGPALLELDPGDPADDETLALVHPRDYIRLIGNIAASSGGFADGNETYVGRASDQVARLAVSAVMRAADAVIAGQAQRAFAAVRPPGHHAEPATAMGFCLYANAALAVRHLQQRHGLARVAVVDFDVHHGNGTQAVFWRDSSVLNISLHQDPRTLWPGIGFAHEVGEGDGRGFTVNIPLPPGTDDERYLAAMRQQVVPRVLRFKPEALVVCAGFDAHAADPLAQLALSSEGFGQIGAELARLADEICGGRLIATLEGGYNLRALAQSVVAFLRALT